MREIHLILDASAIEAYARGSEHVGEPLTQVEENGAAFSMPLAVLAAAGARVDRAWVEVLTAHPAFEPLDLDWWRWPELTRSVRRLGRIDAAEALLLAFDAGGDVLTAEPSLYAALALGDDTPVIPIAPDERS